MSGQLTHAQPILLDQPSIPCGFPFPTQRPWANFTLQTNSRTQNPKICRKKHYLLFFEGGLSLKKQTSIVFWGERGYLFFCVFFGGGICKGIFYYFLFWGGLFFEGFHVDFPRPFQQMDGMPGWAPPGAAAAAHTRHPHLTARHRESARASDVGARGPWNSQRSRSSSPLPRVSMTP